MIVLDTNAILDIYNLSEESQIKVIQFLNNKINEIVLPYQVYSEFLKHYKERRGRAKSFLSNSNNSILKLLNEIIDKYSTIKGKLKQYDSNIINLVDAALASHRTHSTLIKSEVLEIIKTYSRDINDENDIVLEFVNKIYNQQKPRDFYLTQKIRFAQDAKIRYGFGFGPGKTDTKKDDKNVFSPYGDYFIWLQTCNALRKKVDNLQFVTNEKKIDWWENIERKKPAQILIEEFSFICANKTFEMLCLNEFLEKNIYDPDLKAELECQKYLLSKIRDFKNVEYLLDDITLTKLSKSIDDFTVYDHISGEPAGIGTIGDVELIEINLINKNIKETNFDDETYIFNVIADLEYNCKARCLINVSRNYDESGEINFIIKQRIQLRYDVITDLADAENIETCFEMTDCDIIKYEFEIVDYISNEAIEYDDYDFAENYCPRCGQPLTFENDAGDGFCRKCSDEMD